MEAVSVLEPGPAAGEKRASGTATGVRSACVGAHGEEARRLFNLPESSSDAAAAGRVVRMPGNDTVLAWVRPRDGVLEVHDVQCPWCPGRVTSTAGVLRVGKGGRSEACQKLRRSRLVTHKLKRREAAERKGNNLMSHFMAEHLSEHYKSSKSEHAESAFKNAKRKVAQLERRVTEHQAEQQPERPEQEQEQPQEQRRPEAGGGAGEGGTDEGRADDLVGKVARLEKRCKFLEDSLVRAGRQFQFVMEQLHDAHAALTAAGVPIPQAPSAGPFAAANANAIASTSIDPAVPPAIPALEPLTATLPPAQVDVDGPEAPTAKRPRHDGPYDF